MALGVTLLDLRNKLLAETVQSLSPGQTIALRDTYNLQLRRTQEEQWRMFEWPHLRLFKDVALSAGVRFYDYPRGLPFDAVSKIHYQEGSFWRPMRYGVTPEDYSVFGGENQQSWPPQKWMTRPTYNETTGRTDPVGQFEIWPVPNRAGTIRFEGQAPLNPLVNDSDEAILDDTLIVLFAAAEVLANQKAEGAQLKLQKAQQFQRKLLNQLGANKRPMRQLSMSGGSTTSPRHGPTPYLDYIPQA